MNNIGQNTQAHRTLALLVGFFFIAGLYASSLYSYLLFHTLIELFSIVVSFTIFILAWNTRQVQENHYLLFLGIAFLFTGALEMLHTLAYKDFGVLPANDDANLPTQLWIAFRYLAALSFLCAPLFITRKLDIPKTVAVYTVVTSLLILAVSVGFFPDCFIEGRGLTDFKIYSEYFIIILFLAGLGLLIRDRGAIDRAVLRLMAGSIVASVLSELSFTQYVSVIGPANMIGHFFLLASVVCIYQAIVVTGIVEPARLLFRNLMLSEEKISLLNEELSENILQLEASNRELESFSYSVSHDLRAPLRSVTGFSHALVEEYADRLDETGLDYLERILAASGRMGQLIDDLLNLSRISRAEIKREDISLSGLAGKIAYTLRHSQPERQAEFIIAEGLAARGDEHLLTVVLENLLGNAWKFTGNNPLAMIELGITEHEGRQAYFVKDNGAGFDMTYAGKMFNPFQRLHTTSEFPGTGIGLSIVERIIQRHGGRIWAEGEVGKGAVVYFTLG